ncbi:hypothetical protein WM23_04715 [Burkholderia ubonensis]|nr:hypothetical protein WM23_04715 [Burkholderia ubonensis]
MLGMLIMVGAGCAVDVARTDVGAGLAYHADVKQNDDGTYAAAVEASLFRGRIEGARSLATKDAQEKCQSMGKQVNVVNEETGSNLLVNGVAKLTFRCE